MIVPRKAEKIWILSDEFRVAHPSTRVHDVNLKIGSFVSIKAIILSYLNQCGGHFPHKRREVGDFVQRPYDIWTKIVGDAEEKVLKVSNNQSYNL